MPNVPSSATSVPAYRRHKKPGKQADRAYVTIGGRQVYLGRYQSPESVEKYDRLIAEFLANGRVAIAAKSGGISINELLLAYLEHAASYYETEGKRTHEYDEMRYAVRELASLYGMTPASEFGPLELKAVQERLVETGLSRGSVNRRVTRIRRVFSWAVENCLVDPMVHYALKKVRDLQLNRTTAPEMPKVLPVEVDRVEAVEPFVNRQVWAMIRLQLTTGMRPGEVVQMRPSDIDRSEDVWVYRPRQHKTRHRGHDRQVFLGPEAQRILDPWLDRELEAFLFSPAEAERERRAKQRAARKTKVQPSQRNRRKAKAKRRPGKRYNDGTYYVAVQRACTKAGVNRWHPNQLRHTAATEFRKKYGLETTSILLGHKDPKTTQIYAERDEKRAIEAVRDIE